MKILVLDIETSPNLCWTWGLWQQNIGLPQIEKAGETLCWAAKWHGEEKVHFGKGAKGIWKLLDQADVVVHFNGQSFDIPTLQRDFLLAGLKPPSPYKQVDLRRICKQKFRFVSGKLDFIAQQIGIGGKVKHSGMKLWLDCLDGKREAWAKMKEYNIQDVLLTEELYNIVLPWITNHPNWGVYLDAERPTCRNCGSERVIKKGIERTAARTYQRYQCQDCLKPLQGTKCLTKTPKGLTK